MLFEETESEEGQEDSLMGIVMLYFLALIAPFLLVPVERVLPYPHVVEELVKVVLVGKLVSVLRESESGGWGVRGLVMSGGLGLAFAVSESMLFMMNAFGLGDASVITQRLLLTVPMHVLTTMTIYIIGRRGKLWLAIGWLVGMMMHFGFNFLVG